MQPQIVTYIHTLGCRGRRLHMGDARCEDAVENAPFPIRFSYATSGNIYPVFPPTAPLDHEAKCEQPTKAGVSKCGDDMSRSPAAVYI